MTLINKLDNTASITYGDNPINSNTVFTILLPALTILKAADKLTAAAFFYCKQTMFLLPRYANIKNRCFINWQGKIVYSNSVCTEMKL